MKVWHGIGERMGELHSELPKDIVPSATAVRFLPTLTRGRYSVCVGQETGELTVWTLSEDQLWSKVLEIPKHLSHWQSINRIKFN